MQQNTTLFGRMASVADRHVYIDHIINETIEHQNLSYMLITRSSEPVSEWATVSYSVLWHIQRIWFKSDGRARRQPLESTCQVYHKSNSFNICQSK